MGSSRIEIAPTRADGRPVPFDHRPLRADEATPGDLLFVGAEDTPLGAVIGELDGCAFSHVGLLDTDAGGSRVLLSARTDRDPSVESLDLGGIRADPLDALDHRELFVAPLRLGDATRSAGLARMRAWADRDDGGAWASRSRFSYAKLVVAAAGLAAVRRRRPLGVDAATELWERTVAAAEALGWTDDVPGFYCAEAVAAAYGLEYTTDALWVRDGEPHPVGLASPSGGATPPDEDRLEQLVVDEVVVGVTVDDAGDRLVDLTEVPSAEAALEKLDDIVRDLLRAFIDLGLTPAQGWAAARLLVTLWRYDPILGRRLVVAGWELAGGHRDDPHQPTPLPAGTFAAPPFVAGVEAPLPTALVTPRMLLSDAVVRSVHRLAR